MTCIVGYVTKDNVYIGGDSAGVGGLTLSIRKDPKVFKTKRFIIGFTSSFRMGQLLMSSKFNPPEQSSQQSDYDYMVTTFIDSVIALFRDNGFLTKEKEEFRGGTFLVGYKGKLYEIEDDYQVGEQHKNFHAVGCGHDIAKGVMYAIEKNNKLTPEHKIKLALEAASEFSAGVRPPFNVMSLV